MEPFKNVLTQAGHLVQQAAQTVAEAFRTVEETTKHAIETITEAERPIQAEMKLNDEQEETRQQPNTAGGYRDQQQESDAKVLPTSWPDLKGKTLQEAQEFIKGKGYSNIKIMKKGTSSGTEHDESRVILYIDENDIVVEEPCVG